VRGSSCVRRRPTSAAGRVLLRSSGVAERSYYRALKALDDKGYVTRKQLGKTTHITLTDAGSQALLPTSANDCQAAAATTAANPPLLGVGSGRRDGLATVAEEHTYQRALVEDNET